MEKETRVEIIEMGGDVMTKATMALVWKAFTGGVKSPGDSVTIMVPAGVEVGLDRDKMEELGEYEIVIRRV